MTRAATAERFNGNFNHVQRNGSDMGFAVRTHAPEVKVCPSCRGKKEDRFGFDCSRCLGEGTVDE